MSEGLTATQRVEKREQYKKWIRWSAGLGGISYIISLVAWEFIDEPLVLFAGTGLYWLGVLGMGIGYWFSPVSVRDELEQRMEREASQTTLMIAAAVAIIGLPAQGVLDAGNIYSTPAVVQGAIWGYVLLIFIYGAAHWIAKRRYA